MSITQARRINARTRRGPGPYMWLANDAAIDPTTECRMRIASGYYDTPEVIDETVDAIIDSGDIDPPEPLALIGPEGEPLDERGGAAMLGRVMIAMLVGALVLAVAFIRGCS